MTETVETGWGGACASARGSPQSPSYDDFSGNFESYEGEAVHFEYGAVYQTLYDPGPGLLSYDCYQMCVTNNEQQYEGEIAVDWCGASGFWRTT